MGAGSLGTESSRYGPFYAVEDLAIEQGVLTAQEVDCGCEGRDKVLAATSRAQRWNACGQSTCGALAADAIRGLMDDQR